MGSAKKRDFAVKPETKTDKRLTRMLVRLGVMDHEDISARLSSLKDLSDKLRKVEMETVIKEN